MTAVNLGMLLPSDCSLQSLCSSILPLLSMAGVDRHHYLAISQMDNLGDVTADVVVPSPYRPLPTTLWRGVMDENEQRHPLLTYRLEAVTFAKIMMAPFSTSVFPLISSSAY